MNPVNHEQRDYLDLRDKVAAAFDYELGLYPSWKAPEWDIVYYEGVQSAG